MNEKNFYLKCLDTLIGSTIFGEINVGATGELVARICLIKWFDRIHFLNNKGNIEKLITETEIKVSEFINHLFEISEINTKEESKQCIVVKLDGLISFTHFIPLLREIDATLLKDLYERRAAAVLKPGIIGSDLIIPVKLENNEFGGIVIQVKNMSQSTIAKRGKDFYQQVAKKNVVGVKNIFGIIFSLRDSPNLETIGKTICICGLPPFFDENESKLLEAFLTDISLINTSDYPAAIVRMDPLRYDPTKHSITNQSSDQVVISGF